MSIGGHALAVIALQPLVVAALWLTGGADAYMGPMLVLPMLYVAYFFPARYAWPLAVLEVAHLRVAARHLATARTTCCVAPHARLRRRLRRPGRDDPVPQAPPGRRRAPPAPDGPRRPADRPAEPARVRRGARPRARATARASRCCSPTSTPSSRSTTASATRPATASCASSPPTPRPRSAPATAWRGSAATSSRWSPRARAPRPPSGWPTTSARRARTSTPATARSPDRRPSPSTPRTAPTASRSCAPLDRELHAIKDARARSSRRSSVIGAARAGHVGAAVAGDDDHAVVHARGAPRTVKR